MLTKIKNVICHPSMLGMYLGESFPMILLTWFFFFVFTVVLLAGCDMHQVSLDKNYSNYIAESIVLEDMNTDLVFDSKTLKGETKKIVKNEFVIYLCDNSYVNNGADYGLIYVFKESCALMYWCQFFLGRIDYKDCSLNGFSLSSLKGGDITCRIALQDLTYKLVSQGETSYRSILFAENLGNFIGYYFVTLFATYFFAFLVNPPIGRKIRLKLVIYDSISYFVILWFDILFGFTWLWYVALGCPLVYAFMTFRRIRKI